MPDNHRPERSYTAKVLFGEMLGLDYKIEWQLHADISIQLENKNELKFTDHFFNKFKSGPYLHAGHLPQEVIYISQNKNPFLPEANLPILFGNTELKISSPNIHCGIDIFAGTFLMLTRWEEYINPERDQYNRFPGSASIAVKNDFIHRPIVNEYVEMLWNMLAHLGIKQKRKKRYFKTIITHDVDLPLLWRSSFSFIKKIGGDILKRNSIKDATYSFKSYSSYISGKSKDPYDTFDELMDISENCGLKSHFFFLCGGQHKEDNGLPLSHPFIRNLLKKINERGHVIGFHPSFDSYNNEGIYKQELKILQAASPQTVTCGRQHFLRFDVPGTWQLWEAAGMEWESSMYYPDAPGFRCGTCDGFPVFDVLERKELKVREMPLTAMEVSWNIYEKSSPAKLYAEINGLKNTVKKYNGTFVLLWHNSSFNVPDYIQYSGLYEELLTEVNTS